MAAPQQQQAVNDIELDDDELLDMMGDMQPAAPARPMAPAPASMLPPITDTLAGKPC